MGVNFRYGLHQHSGKLRPHRETSYGLLCLVMLLTGVVLAGVSVSVGAATSGGGEYEVAAVVPGPRPASPAVISSPVNGQVFQANPVVVSGSCPERSLVKIFRNNILNGSILCGASGRFSVPVDLSTGKNDLTAIPYNALDEPGPNSAAVSVTLNLPPGGLGFSTELVLQSVSYYRGSLTGQKISWPLDLIGGQSPYAVNIDWGDGSSDLASRSAPGPFTLEHTYNKAGNYLGSYPLIIRATDSAGHTAFLQLTTIVNDSKGGISGSTKSGGNGWPNLTVLWPLWAAAILMIVTFWLGERREKHILMRRFEAGA